MTYNTLLARLLVVGSVPKSSAFRLPLNRFQHVISPVACQSLVQQGYAVVDNLFGSTWSQQLKQELIQLKQQGKMHLNSTHLVRQDRTELLEKQHVFEAEMSDEAGSHALHVPYNHTNAWLLE